MNEAVNVARALKKTHENITVGIGITIGFILIAYFFSFAALIDHMKPGFVTFQVITTVLFVLCLVYLKRVAFFFTKLKFGKKQPYFSVLTRLTSQDFEQDEDTLAAKLSLPSADG